MLLTKKNNTEKKKEINKNINNLNINKKNIGCKNITNDNSTKNNTTYTKEELKNIDYVAKLIGENNQNLLEQLENFEYLDSGGESNVYNVTIKKTKRKCVMKLIINSKREKRNYKEINISKKLKHKNIIDLLYYTPLNNTESDIILMEKASLGNLKDFLYKKLKRTVYSESLLCYMAYQI